MKDFKSGTYINQGRYKSFQPSPINRKWVLEDMELMDMLSRADRQIGRLDMFSQHIPNIQLFISMHVLKEATKSSKIEGTQTNIEEAILDKEDIALERREDWDEVNNYILAMNRAIQALDRIPFSLRLIKETHKVLMTGVRGEHKLPGELRRSQNWIGGASIDDARFIPPVHTSVGELMSDLEKFVHNDEPILPDLLKVALMHYQFETIHPFLDGNGRIGRLLITLYLVDKGILKQPVLYLSDFFERNQLLYYDNLMNVRTNNDLKQWFRFFLVGVLETAEKGIATFDAILTLKSETEAIIQSTSNRSHHIFKIMEALYQKPVINAQQAADIAGVSPATGYKIIDEMIKMKILREITGAKRGRKYVYSQYLDLF